MTDVRTLTLRDEEVLIQVVELNDERGLRPAGTADEIAEKSKDAFDALWRKLRPIAEGFGEEVATMGPEEVQLKFGLSLGVDFNWFVGSADAGANFEVTMKWSNLAD